MMKDERLVSHEHSQWPPDRTFASARLESSCCSFLPSFLGCLRSSSSCLSFQFYFYLL
ncbi:hypothetical protein HanRHA438_Chr15g0714561 [Helianthus annuus]|nr:hypothetical protein HanIR_Chr15g0763731 [Helianthus annuus]KAJ0845518.1 hypothetical protein HanRHA438_Chr15g0714561 [Helianthus annuus]